MAAKKVFANLFSRVRISGEEKLRCVVEYVFISGAERSGKTSVDIAQIRNEAGITDDLKDALVTHLNTKYSPEVFSAYDIVGPGV